MSKQDARDYWKANIRTVVILLGIWFVVGFVCSILYIDPLNSFKIGKIGLGFWFAQQGSIFVFVLLVLIYAVRMDRLDRKYDVGD